MKIRFAILSAALAALAPCWPQDGEAVEQVLPETSTLVDVSNKSINWFRCMSGKFGDIVYSREKGIMVDSKGSDAFVKFKVNTDYSGKKYATEKNEIFFFCGQEVYKVILNPKGIESRTVRLGVPKLDDARRNAALYKGRPLEETALEMIKSAYRDEIPENYDVGKSDGKPFAIGRLEVRKTRTMKLNGIGLALHEFVGANVGEASSDYKIELKSIVDESFGMNPVAVCADPLIVGKGAKTRIWIVVRETGEPIDSLWGEKP